MEKFSRNYHITNAVMSPDFRLSPMGAALLFQDCFAIYMARHKIAAFDLREFNRMWIINDFSMRFLGEQPFWGNTVTIELWISEDPTIKVHADFRIKLEGRTVVEGDSSWAILDMNSRRPLPAHQALPKFDIIQEFGMDTHHHKYPASTERISEYKHLTNSSDTDFNHHISNMTDLRICFDAMDSEYLSSHTVDELSIKFLREAFLGEELTCKTYKTDKQDVWNYDIIRQDGNTICHATVIYGNTEA